VLIEFISILKRQITLRSISAINSVYCILYNALLEIRMKKLFINEKRYYFQAFAVIVVIWFSSLGCVTKQVWEDRVHGKPYPELILSFYANKEKKEILFIGEKYHYIFNKNTENFIDLLQAKDLLKLTQKNLSFYAMTGRDDPRVMQSDIHVQFKKSDLNSEQREWLEAHHFREQEIPLLPPPPPIPKDLNETERRVSYPYTRQDINLTDFYMTNYNIGGSRYLATPEVNSKILKLKEPIPVDIMEFEIEKKNILYKIAMTPLTVTADAVLIVVGAGAVVIMSPVILYQVIKQKSSSNSLPKK